MHTPQPPPPRGEKKGAPIRLFVCVPRPGSKGKDHSMIIHRKGPMLSHSTLYRQQGAHRHLDGMGQ